MAMLRILSNLFLAVLLCAAAAQTGGNRVIEVLHQFTLEEPTPVEVRAVPIRAGVAAPPAKASPQADYPMAFGGPEQNSRLPGSLPAAAWSIRWQSGLNGSAAPNHVVQAADRILTEGGGLWQLFDLAGMPVAQGRYMGSHVVLDSPHSLFYFIDTNNLLMALHLADAGKLFMIFPSFGENFVRPLLVRQNNRFVLAATELEGAPHRPAPPNLSVIEYDELGPELKTGRTGLLFSLTARGKLLIRTNKFAAAMHDDTVAFAVPGRIYLASSDMKVKGAFDGDFEPFSLSMDESGRMYFVALRGGRYELWILSPDGALIGSHPLKPGMERLVAPPIVAYDHRVFVVSSSTILALDPACKLLWEAGASSPIAGAAVTADGRLLVSTGAEVSAFDEQGRRTTLHSFSGDSLTSAPVLTGNQELLVASRSFLYCLKAEGR